MIDRDDDIPEGDDEELDADKCPNCGSPVAWEDVCAECGQDLDEEAEDDDFLEDELPVKDDTSVDVDDDLDEEDEEDLEDDDEYEDDDDEEMF